VPRFRANFKTGAFIPGILLKNVKTNAMAEPQSNKEAGIKTEPLAIGWKRLLNYKSIVKQLPFFLFLTVLAVLYIYNGHFADKTIRNINKTAREVKELQYEYKTVKSEVMFRSQQSELAKAVEPLGLKEMTTAAVMLKDSIAN
jgi:hypothetical protein